MTGRWESLATAMTEALVAAGDLTEEEWQRAFIDTPRHLFVPECSPSDAYALTALTTQWRIVDRQGNKRPTSSASSPTAVAVMLEQLAVREHHRVLEIGTGTGYNAALLCHRLGSPNVYSNDLDVELVDQARQVLATLGYQPVLVAADGYAGLPDGAPYDRILATCAVNHVPPEWIRQLADGGRIVAPIAGNSSVPLLVLDKTAPDEVTGRFSTKDVGFMPLRHNVENPLGPGETAGSDTSGMAHYGTTTTDPRRVHGADPSLALFCKFHVPGLRFGYDTDSGQSVDPARATTVVVHTAHATATVAFESEHGRWPVIQRGPQRVWDTIETAVELWDYLKQPDIARFGVSALDDTNRQYVWLDDPEGRYSWPLPI